ncbi:hypothetical protein VTK26DRAFT_7357 [Humicola hyalothermophila]
MTPPENRSNDRTSYYTMKTQGLVSAAATQGLGHARSSSQPYLSGKTTSPSPLPSPGQPHPPRLSPGAAWAGGQDGRTTSPNYFGLAVDPTTDSRDLAMLPRENWSSPSSSVKSFGAAIPKPLPLDVNPEFEAFRRQIDVNMAKAGFGLSASHFNLSAGGGLQAQTPPPAPTSAAVQRPRPPRWHTQGNQASESPWPRPQHPSTALGSIGGLARGKANRDADNLQEDSAYVSADSNRSSAVSLSQPSLAIHAGGQQEKARLLQSQSPFTGPKLSLPPQAVAGSKPISPRAVGAAESAAQMSAFDSSTMISPAELKELLEKDQGASVLLLDIRISPQFAQARVRGALNLCIPTTLLKRATFNLQKLQQTFQTGQDQEKFANWRSASHLVVYDGASSEKRDAVPALNMIKKFTNEGYTGSTYILRGGFNAFAAAYPNLIDRSSGGPVPGLSLGAGPVPDGPRSSVPPVIGGVVLPKASHLPSPFFANIRQNQDLVDGVGQMDIGVPPGLSEEAMPRWLREAAEPSDRGKRVSDKFLRIELLEQSRMREAYSLVKSEPSDKSANEMAIKVQLSGIEKGGKNRYKDILPFEHARVRLLGRPEGGCDYVNASHLRAKRSYKRYIASQGPLPATFEDFWSVVWDQDVRVIVMLTAESEGGQLKCDPYWKSKDYGSIKLRVISEKKVALDIGRHRPPSSTSTKTETSSSDVGSSEGARRRANTTSAFDWGVSSQPSAQSSHIGSQAAETPSVVIRKFALSHAAHPFEPIREVTQLHYPSWPDFGAPAQPSHLLALVELANVMQRATAPTPAPVNSVTAVPGSGSSPSSGRETSYAELKGIDSEAATAARLSLVDGPELSERARPMLVHCSAGCGRTGAFCTVDSVIDMLKRQRRHALAGSTTNGDGAAAGQGQEQQQRANGQALMFSSWDSDGDVAMAEEPPPPPPPSSSNGTTVPAPAPAPSSAVRSTTTDQHDHNNNNNNSSSSSSTSNGGGPGSKDNNNLPDIDTSWLDDDGLDLIAQTVEDFRSQRLSMVQSLRQFVLCYETVLEWLARLQRSGSSGGGGGAQHDVKGRVRSGSMAL